MAVESQEVRYDFNGRTAVVTGGSSGIGAAIAATLSQSGAEVVVWDRAARSDGRNAFAVDVTQPGSITEALDATLAGHGRVDMLVNSAGYAGPTLSLENYPPREWRNLIEINLIGVFNVCQAVVPYLRRSDQGRIVNIASLAGKEGTPNASAYSAAKAGVIALTKSLGKELADSGVLANVIAPAAVDTPLLQQMSSEHVETMIRKSPMGRLGSVEEVARLVLWLCSRDCSFSTGSVFDLSGGRATY